MGEYGRRRIAPGGRYEYAMPFVAKTLNTAVDKIRSHVAQTDEAGVYDSAGVWQGRASEPALAAQLDRRRIKVTPFNTGALIAVGPGDDVEDVRDRMYLAHCLATPRVGQLLWVEQVLYAAVGIGHVEPIHTRQIETLVDHVKLDIIAGRFDARRLLAADAAGLRDLLGLPPGPWTATADAAAERGRQACAPLRPAGHEIGLVQLTRLLANLPALRSDGADTHCAAERPSRSRLAATRREAPSSRGR